MSNSEHVSILKQGVGAWNQWRKDNREIVPDLSDDDFIQLDLSGYSFTNAHIIYSSFIGCDLSGAGLQHANLNNTVLSHANLKGAFLSNANLNRANLGSADLSGSNISYAYLVRTKLNNADLSNATLLKSTINEAELKETNFYKTEFYDTSISNCNFSSVKNLSTAIHENPSAIDYLTLLKSKNLPINFLRGCGLPEDLVQNYFEWNHDVGNYHSCFISYSSKDELFVQKLYSDLKGNGVRCWFAPEDLKIGDKTRVAIDNAIHIYDKLLLIISESSVNSQWVEQEVEKALEKERTDDRLVLFPICIDDSVFQAKSGWGSFLKNSRNIGNFIGWEDFTTYNTSIKRLFRDLNSDNRKSVT